MRVVIIGGGLGGLCLAQGLRKSGIEFSVYERDASPTSRLQGYRLSMTPSGLGALKDVLPSAQWDRLVKASTKQIRGIGFVDQNLEPKFFKENPPEVDDANRYVSVSRTTLRDVLLDGIREHVKFGNKFDRYEQAGEKIRCYFNDETVDCDILVGADGVNSKVRAQRLQQSNRIDTEVVSIAGKVYFDTESLADFYGPPIEGNTVVLDALPQGLFLAPHDIDEGENHRAYVFWSFLTKRDRYTVGVESLKPVELKQTVDSMTEGWHPRLKKLIAAADLESVMALRYQSSTRPELGEVSPITLIGDAVHNMPPTGGEGANMALRDACLLARNLGSAKSSDQNFNEAIRNYEDQMLAYAFAAVDASMHNLHRMVTRKPQS